ncbi:galactose mutarotase-like enzyme [Flavobacterium arsenatis]|uniref:Galactose mutarotase-like enzyme n=1 Tax=Flavobacterium arsenatis TaxID=1484332 RepID=A0ABU1TNY7_9FLAO|nr:aldose 1-epimerase family protein [Flavobacterium arsenatis]MDR6967682.1 galactose mutarotase-like enzyme [Flavobacterium arsenatis]
MEVTIKNSNFTATINSKGAELISLKSNNREFIWEGNPTFWGKHSPVLFPIVGTLKNNEFQYSEQNYTLSRHGFARDMDFVIREQSENKVVFSLEASETTLKYYPFIFELQLIYVLEQNKLSIQYKVLNKDKKEIPFSIGAHPAFALPENFENYSLSFEEDQALQYFLLENDLLSDKTEDLNLQENKLYLNYQLFERDALVFKQINSKSITINENGKPVLKVNFNDFPNLGIWTKVNAPFICIEPWFGYSDTNKNTGNILEKEGIIILEADKFFESEFSIEIQ